MPLMNLIISYYETGTDSSVALSQKPLPRAKGLRRLDKLKRGQQANRRLHAHCMQQDIVLSERSAETIILASLILFLHEKRTWIPRRPRVRGVIIPTKARARARTMETARARITASSPGSSSYYASGSSSGGVYSHHYGG